MPKIGKIKFSTDGSYQKNTREYGGDYEMEMHYDKDGDYFHFKREDVVAAIGEEAAKKYNLERIAYHLFIECKTKDAACKVILHIVSEASETKKWLEINVSTPIDSYVKTQERKGETNEDFRAMFKARPYFYEDSYLGIGYKRYVSTTSKIGTFYQEVKHKRESWDSGERFHSFQPKNLVEWTPEIQMFLDKTQAAMDEMSVNVLDFFNKPKEELIEEMTKGAGLLISKE